MRDEDICVAMSRSAPCLHASPSSAASVGATGSLPERNRCTGLQNARVADGADFDSATLVSGSFVAGVIVAIAGNWMLPDASRPTVDAHNASREPTITACQRVEAAIEHAEKDAQRPLGPGVAFLRSVRLEQERAYGGRERQRHD